MALGSAIVCAVNSGFIWDEFRTKLEATEALARDKGRRGKIIQEKAAQLAKRQIFESQDLRRIAGGN